ncbi:MAG TPA: hypothetical protein EYN06_00120 [Myxococcales bacterium]|nr:hypothetical protein [Myxococcales bacterium]HIN84853.1 hypothetical protein [Myxococcales bacterium]
MFLKTQYLPLFILCALLTQCGTNFKIQPLVGEDPDIIQMIGVSEGTAASSPTVRAVEQLYRAARSRNTAALWKLLTRDTRVALDALGRKLDSNGKALLKSGRFPVPGTTKTAVRAVDLVALFLLRRPTAFKAVNEPNPAAVRSTVLVSNSQDETRRIVLRREEGVWRIHQPKFTKFPNASVTKLLLLPQDQPKPKALPTQKKAPLKTPELSVPKKNSTLDF